MTTKAQYRYDVALSFTGEDRRYVEQVAEFLNGRALIVFTISMKK
jgi:hypothetical protein